MIQRKKVNSSKVNLILSVGFHTLIIGVAFYFAAREGMLGKKLKQIAVTMVKEKKPEPPKEKPEEPKPEPAKAAETPKPAAPVKAQTASAPPPATEVPAAAPPAADIAAFEFNDGAKAVMTTSDPNAIYKSLVENALRSRWNRPEDMQDDAFVAEVRVRIDPAGRLSGYDWLKGSGDNRWDATVKQALAQTKVFSRPPPKGFPAQFMVRFDVEATRTETIDLGMVGR